MADHNSNKIEGEYANHNQLEAGNKSPMSLVAAIERAPKLVLICYGAINGRIAYNQPICPVLVVPGTSCLCPQALKPSTITYNYGCYVVVSCEKFEMIIAWCLGYTHLWWYSQRHTEAEGGPLPRAKRTIFWGVAYYNPREHMPASGAILLAVSRNISAHPSSLTTTILVQIAISKIWQGNPFLRFSQRVQGGPSRFRCNKETQHIR